MSDIFHTARPSATDLTQRNREAESAEPIGVRGSAPDEKKLSDLGLSAPLRETKTESTEEPLDPNTPNPALDFVLANPPMGDIPPADEPLDPNAPKLVPGEARHMSIPEASGILMELARKRSMSIDQVNALEMAVRRLMCRHFQRQRNWAKRRAARLAEDGSPHQVVPEVPEVSEVPEVPAVTARPEEEAAQ